MARAIKISQELADAAQKEAELMSRSLTKQIEHWANLGRRLERSGMFSHRQFLKFLDGSLGFEDLTYLEKGVASEALMEEYDDFEPPPKITGGSAEKIPPPKLNFPLGEDTFILEVGRPNGEDKATFEATGPDEFPLDFDR